MANSDAEAGELELSSEDDHSSSETVSDATAAAGAARKSAKGPEHSAASASGGDDQAEAQEDDEDSSAVQAAGADAEDASTFPPPRDGVVLDDGGLSYASLLWDNTKAALDQADDSRNHMKKMVSSSNASSAPIVQLLHVCCRRQLSPDCVSGAVQLQFLQAKAELDRSYAKSLRKLVEKATPEERPHGMATAARQLNASPAGTPTPGAAAVAASGSSSSFELLLSSFRHLSLTLSTNLELLAAKVEEQLVRPFTAAQLQHQRETRRIADEVARLSKQLHALQDALLHSKANAKKACQDLLMWSMEHRDSQPRPDRAASSSRAAVAAGIGEVLLSGGVDSHTVFDDLVSSFRHDADSLRKRTLALDGRYVAAVKAVRSYRPQHDAALRQLMLEAQREEEARRQEQLRAVQAYCELQTAMFDKYGRSVRAVTAMAVQVNSRREMRQWIREQRGDGRVEPLPNYVMHKGHPRYDETREAEEQHEHEGLTDDDDDDDESGAATDDHEADDEDEAEADDADDAQEAAEAEDSERESSAAGRRRRRAARRQHRKGGDELDELQDEKTEERIVAEKVLRVFVYKTIGHRPTPATAAARDSAEAAALELASPSSANLTEPLPRAALVPVTAEDVGDGAALDSEEEQAARAIFSTRDGRNAFATIFSCLSPSFYATQQPLSLFSVFTLPPSAPPTLTLPPASFAALSALTALFLDAAAASGHLEPAIFVANVAHQIRRARDGPQQQQQQSASAAGADDVMQKEQVECGDEEAAAAAQSLLSHVSSHRLLADARFFSSALFSSLQHQLAHRSLYIHRWHSDAEQDAVMQQRRLLTLGLIGQYSELMRHCGRRRRERRRYVDKQLRVFDLLAAQDGREDVEALRRLNARVTGGAAEEDGSASEDEASPIAIAGLRATGSGSDDDEHGTQQLLRRKEEEKRMMQDQQRTQRRSKVAADVTRSPPTAAPTAQDDSKRRQQEAEEAKEKERRQHQQQREDDERHRAGRRTGFFASLFGRTSPSPSAPVEPQQPKEKDSSRNSPASPPTAAAVAVGGGSGKVEAALPGSGVRIPIPIATAVSSSFNPPVTSSSAGGAPAATAPAVASSKLSVGAAAAGASLRPAAAAAAPSLNAAAATTAGDAAVRKRIVRKKPSVSTTAAAAGGAAQEPRRQAAAAPVPPPSLHAPPSADAVASASADIDEMP